jgi:lipoate-protein ligase A
MMKFIRNDSINPYFNIAFEEFCFEKIALDEDYFIIWQNGPSIILGSHQNVFQEINPHFVYGNNLPVVRRISGGGTVYHDLGNLNFTFIFNTDEGKQIDYVTHNKKIMAVLATLGLETTMSKRHDILYNGKKISGNAQRVHKNRVLHHGTLLFSTNLNKLEHSLYFMKKSIQSKAIDSVRSQVTNIGEDVEPKMMIDQFREYMIKQLSNDYQDQEIVLTDDDTENIQERVYEKFMTWEWNFGESPKFQFQNLINNDGNLWYVDLYVKNGLIDELRLLKNNKEYPVNLVNMRYDMIYLLDKIDFLKKKDAAILFFGENR